MGWFSEQIEERKLKDDEAVFDSFETIASAVTGKRISASLQDNRELTLNALERILQYYHLKMREIPDSIRELNEQIEYIMRPNGMMYRTVKLPGKWYRDAIGAMLGVRKSDGAVVALLPAGISGYCYYDSETGQKVKIGSKNAGDFEEEAIAFYRPLPLKKLTIGSLVRYTLRALSAADYLWMAAATFAVALVGLFGPRITELLFSTVVESGSMRLLAAIAVFSVCVSISTMLLTMVKGLLTARMNTKMSLNIESATMMRVMSLPASFFKQHSAGDLYERITAVNVLCGLLISTVLSTGLTSVFSLVYVAQIIRFAPALVAPALLFTLASLLFTLFVSFAQMGITRRRMALEGEESGMTYALISGVQKIKLAGAEKRAFARWGNLYAKEARLRYNPPMLLKISSVISLAISLTGTLVMYYEAIKTHVSVADYYAFTAAYGMVSGAFAALFGIVTTLSDIRPVLERVEPILTAEPEVSEGKQMVTKLSGAVELNNIYFRYSERDPYVLKNLSLKIRPGQYVAIVGRTGCGKSTLIRLLLGLETPEKGAIYYDGKDISSLELKSLRRKIGTVMQSGKLFQGDIYSNIVISAPWLTQKEAWEAAEMAGIAEDIRRMPMGMNTLISEGAGGVSGGQRQRLMIARAIAPKPKILIFDEATSALDNLTQRKVSESLDGLKCTRIVVAHRLSTIRHCDRIIVLDGGGIVEDGTYEELIAKKGFFADLVERQRLDNET